MRHGMVGMSVEQVMDALCSPLATSSDKEIADAFRLYVIAVGLNSGERDTLRAAYKHGPSPDGDVCSKVARDRLIELGLMAKVVSGGVWGYNAVTHKGAWVIKLIGEPLVAQQA